MYNIFATYCLLDGKKTAQSVWSHDLVHEKTFRISVRIPFGYILTSKLNYMIYLKYYSKIVKFTLHFKLNLIILKLKLIKTKK